MSIKYASPFINEVIFRLDFASAVDELFTKIPKNFSSKVMQIFPIQEPKEVIASIAAKIAPGVLEEKSQSGREWAFFNKNRTVKLIVTSECVIFSYKKYESFDNLKSDVFCVINSLYESYNELQARRIGLRYINKIYMDGNDIFNWSDYVQDYLFSSHQVIENKRHVARAFSELTMNFEDIMLKFQFGIYNTDFPSPIRKKEFILDLDAYGQGLFERADLDTIFDLCHEKIQTIFEASIKDELRKKMGRNE